MFYWKHNLDEKYPIKLFERYKIRTNPEIEDYYYSVIEVIGVLTESKNPRRYWSDLKRKLKKKEVSCTKISYNLK